MSTRGFHTTFVIQNSCNSRAMRYVHEQITGHCYILIEAFRDATWTEG